MSLERIQLLRPDGTLTSKSSLKIPVKLQKDMYRTMILTRLWDEKALNLQRQGRLGTIGSVRGQEAANIGMGYAMTDDDWYVPSFREPGTLYLRGHSLVQQLLQWGGYERGLNLPDDKKIAPICITVGAHLNHAVGVALAQKIKAERGMTLVVAGDGATSQGGFFEALNLAGVYQAPVVFAIQNNKWAISMPFARQSATETVAEKAAAANMDGVWVDGNDVFAVYTTVKKYADRARKESKPALIELDTYRMGDHTTADDAQRYRDAKEVETWREKDPITRLRLFLEKEHGWDEKQENELLQQCRDEVEDMVKEYEETEPRDPREIFNYMYTDMPWNLQEQQQDLESYLNKGDTDGPQDDGSSH